MTSRRAADLADALRSASGGELRSSLADPPLSGRLFERGSHVVLEHVVDATEAETPFVFGTVARGPRGATGTRMVVTTLPRPVPNIVLVSRRRGVLRGAGVALDESQRLALEGDFGASFDLFCPDDYAQDALYVFSPDLMARIVDMVGGCDVELVDNRVLVYVPRAAYSDPDGIRRLPELVAILRAKIERQTARYVDQRGTQGDSADPFRREALLAAGGDDSGHRIARGGHRIRTRLTAGQRVGVGIGILAAAAAGAYWITMVASSFAL